MKIDIEKWSSELGFSYQSACRFARDGRIPSAEKVRGVWFVDSKELDPRMQTGHPKNDDFAVRTTSKDNKRREIPSPNFKHASAIFQRAEKQMRIGNAVRLVELMDYSGEVIRRAKK